MVDASTNPNMIANFSTLQAMQQAQTDPGGRLLGVLPSIGVSVGMPPGIAQAKMVSYAFLGRGPALGGMYRGLFVPMDTLAQWNTHDLGRVSANIEPLPIEPVQISALPIEGPRIEGERIVGPEIRGQEIRGILIEAREISAPRGVGEAASHGTSLNI
jgi:hypothetical protein